MAICKRHVKKGDQVEVIAGKEKGKRGKIIRVDAEHDRVFVEKLNIQKRHSRATQKNPAGGIIEREGPIHISNVKKVEG